MKPSMKIRKIKELAREVNRFQSKVAKCKRIGRDRKGHRQKSDIKQPILLLKMLNLVVDTIIFLVVAVVLLFILVVLLFQHTDFH